jgi:hypothetical protein
MQHRLNLGLLDFESHYSPLLSSQVFFKTGPLPFEKNGLDQTYLFANLNLELVQVQVQVQGIFDGFGKALMYKIIRQTSLTIKLDRLIVLSKSSVLR